LHSDRLKEKYRIRLMFGTPLQQLSIFNIGCMQSILYKINLYS
jgi:hypothetical protein